MAQKKFENLPSEFKIYLNIIIIIDICKIKQNT